MRVAFDITCLTQSRAGTARLARGLLSALEGTEDLELIELGETQRHARGSVAQKRAVLQQDLGWYGGGLARAARGAGADCLHCPTYRAPLRRAGLPTVVTVHDLAVLREPSWFPRWSRTYGHTLMPRSVRRADRVVCVSRSTADDVVRLLHVPEERIRVIPNGIDALFSTHATPPPIEGPYLLAVATPEPRKNLERLLLAHGLLRAAGRHERLVLVGADGWGGVELARRPDVIALGRVGDPILRDLYAGAQALVFPSLWEGFGLPVGEALAAGCRIVCSDLPMLREIAAGDATYCDPLSARSIADAIVASIEAPRPAPRREFTWERAAGAVAGLWRELTA